MSTESAGVRFNAQGTVNVRQPPTRLMMKLPLQATGNTLELGLNALRKQAIAAERWLQGLGANTILVGDPQFVETVSQDPLKKARELAARAMGRGKSTHQDAARTKTVTLFLTAFWDIASKSAEERLVLLDRLQFEASSDIPAEEKVTVPDLEQLSDPMQMQAMLAEMMTPKEEPRQAHFLFVSQLDEASVFRAYQEAYHQAVRKAEMLANCAGHSLGRLESVSYGYGGDHSSSVHRHMEMQSCQAILAGTGYQPGEFESVSEQPTAAEFRLSVSVHYGSDS